MSKFRGSYAHVSPNEDVSAAVTSRAPKQLGNDVQYLYDLIRAAHKGSALLAYDIPVSSDVVVNMPVYFRESTGLYEPALAAASDYPDDNGLLLLDSASVVGMVLEKESANAATLMVMGFAEVDLSGVIVGTTGPGLYFLSSSVPGKITKNKPSVAVPLLWIDAANRVFLLPQWLHSVDRHNHYAFPLQPQPCGTSVTPGDNSTVINGIDTDLEGWLPANHASFGGKAPAGAKFGYNVAANSALSKVWPPMPISSAFLEIDLGTSVTTMGQGAPLGSNRLVVIDSSGIWWMSDYTNDRPWPASLHAGGHTGDDWYADNPTQDGSTPRETAMALKLWFTRPVLATDKPFVTTLRPKSGSRLSVKCLGGTADAVSGDLEIGLDLDLVSGDDDTAGYLVVKETDGDSLLRGPVCEGIIAGTGLLATSDAQRVVGSDTLHMGKVSLGLDPQQTQREVPISWIKPSGVLESYVNQIPSLMFPVGRASSISCVLHLPARTVPATFNVVILAQFAGSVAGAFPDLTLQYKKISRAPTAAEVIGGDALQTLPSAVSSGTISLSDVTLLNPLEYATIRFPAIAAAAGDIVVYSVVRANGDAYSGDIYLLQQLAEIDS